MICSFGRVNEYVGDLQALYFNTINVVITFRGNELEMSLREHAIFTFGNTERFRFTEG